MLFESNTLSLKPEDYRRWLKHLWLLPFLLTLVFAALFSGSLPLIDEWLFLRNAKIVASDGLNLSKLSFHLYDHPVYLPSLLYLPLGSIFNYDSRALIGVTIACFAVMLWTVQRRSALNWWQLAVLALAVFGTGHYMEYMWGNQFTIALSIVLPLCGLSVIDCIDQDSRPTRTLGLTGIGLTLSALGVLCSACGAFGFIAIAILVALKPLRLPVRISIPVLSLAAFYWIAQNLSSSRELYIYAYAESILMELFTALGGVLLGTEVQLTKFGLSRMAVLGMTLVVAMLGLVAIARRVNKVSAIAYPISLFVFGCSCIVAAAASRHFLGNWHLQSVLPAVAGILVAAATMYRAHPSSTTRWLQRGVFGLVALASLEGYVRGFQTNGPAFRNYVANIEHYTITFLQNPSQAIPYQPPANWNLDYEMVLFLSANDHPLFKPQNDKWREVAVGRQPIRPLGITFGDIALQGTNHVPPSLDLGSSAYQIVFASFAIDAPVPEAMVLTTGHQHTHVLRRIDSALVAGDHPPGLSFYSGLVPTKQLRQSTLAFRSVLESIPCLTTDRHNDKIEGDAFTGTQ